MPSPPPALPLLSFAGAAAASAQKAKPAAPGQVKKDPLADAMATNAKLTGALRAEQAKSKKCNTDLATCTRQKGCSTVANNLARCSSALDAATATINVSHPPARPPAHCVPHAPPLHAAAAACRGVPGMQPLVPHCCR